MRCYFLRNAKIEAVELLEPGPDENLIEQAKATSALKSGAAGALSIVPLNLPEAVVTVCGRKRLACSQGP